MPPQGHRNKRDNDNVPGRYIENSDFQPTGLQPTQTTSGSNTILVFASKSAARPAEHTPVVRDVMNSYRTFDALGYCQYGPACYHSFL
jgi:hypothetical protein